MTLQDALYELGLKPEVLRFVQSSRTQAEADERHQRLIAGATARWKQLVKKAHPDQGGDAKTFRAFMEAKKVLDQMEAPRVVPTRKVLVRYVFQGEATAPHQDARTVRNYVRRRYDARRVMSI